MTAAARKKLIAAAREARLKAYAPYSKCMVGAAIVDSRGGMHSGCNVENSTYGATVCAERNAVAAMVRAGAREIREIAIATQKGWFPCGICRQVLMEFTRNPSKLLVHIVNSKGLNETITLANLLPRSFCRHDLLK
ncbi:MAG: cytidine deaminase [Deltaproteobacteria bacterium]|nr:cytidine deaminase [Deltaproteobacteria bacterium]